MTKIDRGLVPVSLITLRDECQPRAAGLDEDVVAEYVEALRRGDELPPLSVVSVLDPAHDLEAYVLVDGYHRFAAHAAEGHPKLEIHEVAEGDLSVAIWHASAANRANGLRRAPGDLVLAIRRARDVRPDASAREIARHVGCSHTYVSNVLKPKVATVATEQTSAPAESLPVRGGASDGLAPPADVADPLPATDPGAATLEEVIPYATSEEVAETLSELEVAIADVTRIDAALRAVLVACKGVAGIMTSSAQWQAGEIRRLRKALADNTPVEHERCGGHGCDRCHGRGWLRQRSVDHG